MSSSFPAEQPHAAPPWVSRKRLIVVQDYSPMEGESAVPITATVDFCHPDDSPSHKVKADGADPSQVKLRLVLGRMVLRTIIRKLDSPAGVPRGKSTTGSGRWQVSSVAPSLEKLCFPRRKPVPLTLQVVVNGTEVLDSVTFGSFSYWESTVGEQEDTTLRLIKRGRERADEGARMPSPYARNNSIALKQEEGLSHAQNREPHDTISRRTKMEAEDNRPQAILEWDITSHTPHPETFSRGWSAAEVKAGRRLIRFHRQQKGHILLAACEPIQQEHCTAADIVISCILCPQERSCWFTSVDVIRLLERLVGIPFIVDEKNRIRRNLQGLKPTSISKKDYRLFFERIMGFSEPKPRNIEKDVKVFPWATLTEALNKILNQYVLVSPVPPARSLIMQKSRSPSPSPPQNHPTLHAHEIQSPELAQAAQMPYLAPGAPLPLPHPQEEHAPMAPHTSVPPLPPPAPQHMLCATDFAPWLLFPDPKDDAAAWSATYSPFAVSERPALPYSSTYYSRGTGSQYLMLTDMPLSDLDQDLDAALRPGTPASSSVSLLPGAGLAPGAYIPSTHTSSEGEGSHSPAAVYAQQGESFTSAGAYNVMYFESGCFTAAGEELYAPYSDYSTGDQGDPI